MSGQNEVNAPVTIEDLRSAISILARRVSWLQDAVKDSTNPIGARMTAQYEATSLYRVIGWMRATQFALEELASNGNQEQSGEIK